VARSSRATVFLRSGNVVAVAAVTAAVYFAGALVGLELRLPSATPSILWPPNAILTALLLFVPIARWWCVIFGGAVGHFAAELGIWPPGLVSIIYLTNAGEALLAAGLIRYLANRTPQFDTLREVFIFVICGGFAAPFISTFFDAGAVSHFTGEDYWTVWSQRFPSNVLAQLAIVPALAGLINCNYAPGTWPRRRWLDATGIGGGLLLVAVVVSSDIGTIGLSRAPLAPFIPVLLWAAVRFGAPGVSVAVFATMLLAIESAAIGAGLLQAVAQEDRRVLLQLFLIASTVPLLCVGALVEERQSAVAALRASDILKSTILSSIPSLVAVVNRDGCVVTVNDSWLAFVGKNVLPGAPYMKVWADLAAKGSAYARSIHDGIAGVLEGASAGFNLEYPCEIRGGEQWWTVSVVPLKGSDGGAVVTHTDITRRKKAEIEAQKSREELAHVSRVWVMGELTASLSHQLNQPLTGIVGNAHAGIRFLKANPVNVGEVHQILSDIINDAERAAEVTRAVRNMLRKEVCEHELLDLNDVVRDMVTLLTSEAIIRNVQLQLRLAPALPLVRGERVQLHQVVLNLMMNALDAVAVHPDATTRTVSVVTEPLDASGVQMSVFDSGGGLPRGAEDQIFEPLFTTKASGMGMGLAIARAIAESHGGTIRAANSSSGGAVFHLTLPFSPEAVPAASGSSTISTAGPAPA
jgi:signal transduction histidine kinase/integral membrane sensor domain MASE1